jgi:hypothetical protein
MFHPADATQPARLSQPSHRARPVIILLLDHAYLCPDGTHRRTPHRCYCRRSYALLLYLLKDAERLEAQRHRAEAEPLSLPSTDPPKASLAFAALPRAHSTDIELLAASGDGERSLP